MRHLRGAVNGPRTGGAAAAAGCWAGSHRLLTLQADPLYRLGINVRGLLEGVEQGGLAQVPAALVDALGDCQLTQLGLEVRLRRRGLGRPALCLAAHSRCSRAAVTGPLHLHDDARGWQYAMHCRGPGPGSAWRHAGRVAAGVCLSLPGPACTHIPALHALLGPGGRPPLRQPAGSRSQLGQGAASFRVPSILSSTARHPSLVGAAAAASALPRRKKLKKRP